MPIDDIDAIHEGDDSDLGDYCQDIEFDEISGEDGGGDVLEDDACSVEEEGFLEEQEIEPEKEERRKQCQLDLCGMDFHALKLHEHDEDEEPKDEYR